jgi:hypothetical protein
MSAHTATARLDSECSSATNESGFYVFVRCWPFFTSSVPYPEFDGVHGADLLTALRAAIVREQWSPTKFRKLLSRRHEQYERAELLRKRAPDDLDRRRRSAIARPNPYDPKKTAMWELFKERTVDCKWCNGEGCEACLGAGIYRALFACRTPRPNWRQASRMPQATTSQHNLKRKRPDRTLDKLTCSAAAEVGWRLSGGPIIRTKGATDAIDGSEPSFIVSRTVWLNIAATFEIACGLTEYLSGISTCDESARRTWKQLNPQFGFVSSGLLTQRRGMAARAAIGDLTSERPLDAWGEMARPLLASVQHYYSANGPENDSCEDTAVPNDHRITADRPPRRNTTPGAADKRILAKLCEHHKYSNGGCLVMEPIVANELARRAGVAGGSVNAFWKRKYKRRGSNGDYESYRRSCGNNTIPSMLAIWNGEAPAAEAVQLIEDDIRKKLENDD